VASRKTAKPCHFEMGEHSSAARRQVENFVQSLRLREWAEKDRNFLALPAQ
jgi:hypothetical protein